MAKDHPEIADLLRNHGGNTSEEIETLLDAALNGDIEAVKQCLSAGVDVNAKADFRGVTPLHDAASNGRKEVVELLLANGADVNAKNESSIPATMAGIVREGVIQKLRTSDPERTPLHFAAQNGQKEIAELLIANGADILCAGLAYDS